MEVEEVRRLHLLELITRYGSQRRLADAAKVSPAQISQWVNRSPDAKTGKPRVMGSRAARDMELEIGLPKGSLDDAGTSSPPASQEMRPPTDSFRTAVEITDRVLSNARVAVTAQARSDITMAVYDLIKEGHGIAGAERTVAQMLRAVGGITAKTD